MRAARSRSDAALDHPLDEQEQHAHEHGGDDDAGDDDVERIQLGHVALEILRLANAEERPQDGEERAPERELAPLAALGACVGIACAAMVRSWRLRNS